MLRPLKTLGPVVQSIVSITSSLLVKMLTVLISTISNSQVFICWKNVSSFCKCKSYSHFFCKNIRVYAIFNDQSFNDTLTNDIISFEELGPDIFIVSPYTLWIHIVRTHEKSQAEALLMRTHNMFLWRNTKNIYLIPALIKNYIQLTLAISTLLISNNRLSQSETLVPA